MLTPSIKVTATR